MHVILGSDFFSERGRRDFADSYLVFKGSFIISFDYVKAASYQGIRIESMVCALYDW